MKFAKMRNFSLYREIFFDELNSSLLLTNFLTSTASHFPGNEIHSKTRINIPYPLSMILFIFPLLFLLHKTKHVKFMHTITCEVETLYRIQGLQITFNAINPEEGNQQRQVSLSSRDMEEKEQGNYSRENKEKKRMKVTNQL